MSTPMIRTDIRALLDRHLAGVDASKLTEKERWDRYRSFRSSLHETCGCGAAPELIDHAQFISAIRTFCDEVAL